MVKRFGTIGHTSVDSLTAFMALMLAAKHAKRGPRILTPEQAAAADNRTERQRWNDEVEARKAAKKGATP